MHDRPGHEASPNPVPRAQSLVDSRYAWARLAAIVALSTLGGVGMWSIIVAMPAIQAEFGVARADASLPYSLSMLGFMVGGVLMGKLADRFGVIFPVVGGTLMLAAGYVATAYAPNIFVFAIVFAITVGMLGGAATFSPLLADASLWFEKRRGMAIALAASGNYLAGTIWPPILEHFIAAHGWRLTHLGIAAFLLVTMLPLAVMLRRAPPAQRPVATSLLENGAHRPLGLPPNLLQGLIMFMGVCCCVAMSMPQVHIVAYCVDLGYGPARGAEMLSLMLGLGIVSRLASGWILDRIGGFATLLIGSSLQAAVLAFYIPFDGLTSLYIISALFGLGQGGIVPSYAFIIRELYPAKGIGLRVSLAVSSTILGMAVGGWMSGAIFDATGSYQLALINGIAWNVLNMAIAAWLLLRQWRRMTYAGASA
jgi:MFS family permease